MERQRLVVSGRGAKLGLKSRRVTVGGRGSIRAEPDLDPCQLALPWRLEAGEPEPAPCEGEFPLLRIASILLVGESLAVTTDLAAACAEEGIPIEVLDRRGRSIGFLGTRPVGNAELRRAQARAAGSDAGLRLARGFVVAKLANQAAILDSGDPARAALQVAAGEASAAGDVPTLVGIEGRAAAVYWGAYAEPLGGALERRTGRGALDPANAGLNYGYGMLYSSVARAVAGAGLDAYQGFLHGDRAGRPSLELDLIEEFRAPVVDRTIAPLLKGGGLRMEGACLAAEDRRRVAALVLKELARAVPYEGRLLSLDGVIDAQARRVAAHVEGRREYAGWRFRPEG
jgi:CRISPR-associated protein Cas1